MNIGALGNMVPQLHIHIIARFEEDEAWPGPVGVDTRSSIATKKPKRRLPIIAMLSTGYEIQGRLLTQNLPKPILAWFEARNWAPHAHQLEMLSAAGGTHCLLIAPTGGVNPVGLFAKHDRSFHRLESSEQPGCTALHFPPQGTCGRYPPKP